MIQKIKFYLSTVLTFLFLLFFCGCSDSFLDLKPYDGLPSGSAISTEMEMISAVNGMYASMRDAGLFGRSLPFINDLMADNVILSINNSSRYLLQNEYTVNEQDIYVADIWQRGYYTILAANNIINSEIISSPAIDQLQGEAYAVRALVYFYLLQSFATPYVVDPDALGIPITTTYNPQLRTHRNTVSEVYTLIINDLKMAEKLMSDKNNSSVASKYVAKGLLAKVYLHMGDMQNALLASQDVIQNGGYSLTDATSLDAYWSNPNPATNKIETLFEITNDAVNNAAWDALAGMYDQSGYGDGLANPELYALYQASDARKNLILEGERGGVPALFINKYQNYTNAANKDNLKILRYADILLIAAEAAAKEGQEEYALATLNELATKRDPTFDGYSYSGTALIAAIIEERRKELAFEGDRMLDLNRLQKPIVRTASEYPPGTSNISADDHRRVMPIPRSEIDANRLIKQNKGY